MSIVVEMMIVILALCGIGVYYGTKINKTAGNKATEIVQSLDEHYSSYLEKQRTLLLMENTTETSAVILSDDNMKNFVDEAFCVLKPEIDALIGQINSTRFSSVKITTQPRFFRNVAALAEALFEKRNQSGRAAPAISEKDEEKLYAAVREAILADLKERALNWRIGNI